MARIKNPTSIGNVPPRSQQVQEIMRCGTNAAYFISKYVKISHPTKGPLPFKTFPYQDRCLDAFQKNRFVITNKSRQLGLSTLSAAYSLWMALFQREKNILVIATKLEVAKNFIKKVNGMYDSLPKWLVMPQIKARSVKYLEFSNGSKIQAIPTGTDAGRSEALSLLIIDEAAHVEGIEELWLGLWPTLSCLVGKTRVFTDTGIYAIEDFHKDREIGEYFELDGIKVFGKHGLEPLSHGYVSPESDTIKVETKNGFEVEGTLKHPLWVLNSNGGAMKQIQDIRIGDYLRIQIGMGCFGESVYGKHRLNKELAYMLGGYIAEGNMIKGKNSKGETVWNGIQITNFDDDFRAPFLNASEHGLAKSFHIRPDRNKLFCFSTAVAKHFIELGVNADEKCSNKHTPRSIWTAKKEDVCSYLSGLFDGDGSVTSRGVVLNSTSKELIEETQLLMSNLGFVTNVYYISGAKTLERERKTGRLLPQGKPVQSLRDSWQLQVSRSQFNLFASTIGFRIPRKQNRLVELAAKYSQDTQKLFTVPVSVIGAPVENILRRIGKTSIWFRDNGLRIDKWKTIGKRGERFVTQSWLTRLRALIVKAGLVETDEEKNFFENILGSFLWSPVTGLKKSTAKTYDFTVPGTHTFIQNGILGSNTGGNAILISSPSGVGTLFHKLWVGAKDGENGDGNPNPGAGTNNFYRIELPWTVHPERDEEWFQQQRAEILPAKGERGVAQELLCSFAASGDNFLSGDILEEMEKNCKTPIMTFGPRGDVWIWKDVQSEHRYLVSADVSRGDADDFSAFHVIDTTADEVVAEFQGKVPPEELANLMIDVGFRYNKALLCPELNSFGLLTANALKKANYPNLYYEKVGRNMYTSYTTQDIEGEIPGFTTGPKNRDEMLAKLETVLRTKRLKVYSMRIVNELKTFVWKNNRAQAMKGYNDDLVISLAIGNSLYEASGVSAWDSTDVSVALLAGISVGTKTMSPIGSYFGGNESRFVPPIMTTSNIKDYAQQQNALLKEDQKKQGGNAQDFRSAWWRQFSWVGDD